MYILDTDISIELLRGRHPELAARLRGIPAQDLGTTAITLAELLYGARRSRSPEANLARAEAFCAPLTLFDFKRDAAAHFAEIKSALAEEGRQIGGMDLLIAAIARSVGAILVTNNAREFSRVPALTVESWLP